MAPNSSRRSIKKIQQRTITGKILFYGESKIIQDNFFYLLSVPRIVIRYVENLNAFTRSTHLSFLRNGNFMFCVTIYFTEKTVSRHFCANANIPDV